MTIANKINEMVQTGVFAKGTVFSRNQFTRLSKKLSTNLFTARKTDRDRQRANLALVRVQGDINRVLATQGYYLKSRDYGNEFYVVSKKKKVKKEVTRYTHVAKTGIHRAVLLMEGLSNRK